MRVKIGSQPKGRRTVDNAVVPLPEVDAVPDAEGAGETQSEEAKIGDDYMDETTGDEEMANEEMANTTRTPTATDTADQDTVDAPQTNEATHPVDQAMADAIEMTQAPQLDTLFSNIIVPIVSNTTVPIDNNNYEGMVAPPQVTEEVLSSKTPLQRAQPLWIVPDEVASRGILAPEDPKGLHSDLAQRCFEVTLMFVAKYPMCKRIGVEFLEYLVRTTTDDELHEGVIASRNVLHGDWYTDCRLLDLNIFATQEACYTRLAAWVVSKRVTPSSSMTFYPLKIDSGWFITMVVKPGYILVEKINKFTNSSRNCKIRCLCLSPVSSMFSLLAKKKVWRMG
mgnify:CR=1 FL=1